ncbi:hypothetical protein, partial [Brasilonema bromeliae]|uniref:hypothetical protein n=1 Tax=Brasilonema bromeliae TaxID=383615 RepID=UPI0030DBCE98
VRQSPAPGLPSRSAGLTALAPHLATAFAQAACRRHTRRARELFFPLHPAFLTPCFPVQNAFLLRLHISQHQF